MSNLEFMILLKLIIGFVVGLVIFIIAKLYYKDKMPENLPFKIFSLSIFYAIFFVETIVSICVLLVLYAIALIFGKRDFTFNKFICFHLPITVIVLFVIEIMGIYSRYSKTPY